MSSSFPNVARARRAALLAAAVVAPLALPAAARAQVAATASVTAQVQQPLAVTKTTDLDFGMVFPGLNKTVAVTDGGAASFAIQGQAGANVNLTFNAPSALASGGNTLPLVSWAARRNTTNSAASGTDFTPSGAASSATLGPGGALYVFVGATAQPAVAQAAGTYSGSLTMTVVYF